MKIFITSTFGNQKEIDTLCSLVREAGFIDYCFARDEGYFENSTTMMQMAKDRILDCDALLVDGSQKLIGRLIETGIAFAGDKKIIVITKENTQVEKAVKGVASTIIVYKELKDIKIPLKNLYSTWSKS